MTERSITFVVRVRNEARDTLRALGIEWQAQARAAAQAALEIRQAMAAMQASRASIAPGAGMAPNPSAVTAPAAAPAAVPVTSGAGAVFGNGPALGESLGVVRDLRAALIATGTEARSTNAALNEISGTLTRIRGEANATQAALEGVLRLGAAASQMGVSAPATTRPVVQQAQDAAQAVQSAPRAPVPTDLFASVVRIQTPAMPEWPTLAARRERIEGANPIPLPQGQREDPNARYTQGNYMAQHARTGLPIGIVYTHDGETIRGMRRDGQPFSVARPHANLVQIPEDMAREFPARPENMVQRPPALDLNMRLTAAMESALRAAAAHMGNIHIQGAGRDSTFTALERRGLAVNNGSGPQMTEDGWRLAEARFGARRPDPERHMWRERPEVPALNEPQLRLLQDVAQMGRRRAFEDAERPTLRQLSRMGLVDGDADRGATPTDRGRQALQRPEAEHREAVRAFERERAEAIRQAAARNQPASGMPSSAQVAEMTRLAQTIQAQRPTPVDPASFSRPTQAQIVSTAESIQNATRAAQAPRLPAGAIAASQTGGTPEAPSAVPPATLNSIREAAALAREAQAAVNSLSGSFTSLNAAIAPVDDRIESVTRSIRQMRAAAGEARDALAQMMNASRQSAFPIRETEENARSRAAGGYTSLVDVDARAFRDRFMQDRGEALEWQPRRTENLRNLTGPVDAYPRVYADSAGRIDVGDGRHRINLAAERGQSIRVAMQPESEEAFAPLRTQVQSPIPQESIASLRTAADAAQTVSAAMQAMVASVNAAGVSSAQANADFRVAAGALREVQAAAEAARASLAEVSAAAARAAQARAAVPAAQPAAQTQTRQGSNPQAEAEAVARAAADMARLTAALGALEAQAANLAPRLTPANTALREMATFATQADRALIALAGSIASVSAQLRAGIPSTALSDATRAATTVGNAEESRRAALLRTPSQVRGEPEAPNATQAVQAVADIQTALRAVTAASTATGEAIAALGARLGQTTPEFRAATAGLREMQTTAEATRASLLELIASLAGLPAVRVPQAATQPAAQAAPAVAPAPNPAQVTQAAQTASQAAQAVSREDVAQVAANVTRLAEGLSSLDRTGNLVLPRVQAINTEIGQLAGAAERADRSLAGMVLALSLVSTQLKAGLPSLKQFETARDRIGAIADAAKSFAPTANPPTTPEHNAASVIPTPRPQPAWAPARPVVNPLAASLQLPSAESLDAMTKRANNAVTVYRRSLETLEALGGNLEKAAASFTKVADAAVNMRETIKGTDDHVRPLSAALRDVQAAADAASKAISALVGQSGRLAIRQASPNVANAAAAAVASEVARPNPQRQPQAQQAPPLQTSAVGTKTAEIMERVAKATTEAGEAIYRLTSVVGGYNAKISMSGLATRELSGGLNAVKGAAEGANKAVAALAAQIAAVDLDSLRAAQGRAAQAPAAGPASPVPNAPQQTQTTGATVREASTAVRQMTALGEAIEKVQARVAVLRVSMQTTAQTIGTFSIATVGAERGAHELASALTATKNAAEAAALAVASLNNHTKGIGSRQAAATIRTMATGQVANQGAATPLQAGNSAASLNNVAQAAQTAIQALQTLSTLLPQLGAALNGLAPGFNGLHGEMKQFRTELQGAERDAKALQGSLSKLNPTAVVNMMAALRQAAMQAGTVAAAASAIPTPAAGGGSGGGGGRPPVTPAAAAAASAPLNPAAAAAAAATAASGAAAARAAPQIAQAGQAARRAAAGFNEMKQGGNSAYGALNDLGFQAFIVQSTLMSLSSITGFGFAVREIAELDKSLAELRATTQATAEQMQEFRGLVTEASRGSNFSENEAARGLIELAKAGLNAEQAMRALRPAMDLANAGGLEMGRATEVMVNIMQTFGASAEQTGQIADILVAAANASTTSVANLATALSYAGTTASELGVSLEETTAAIATLAQRGIDGQKAGSQLRAAMSVLISPTEEAQKVLRKLGITLREVDPSRVGLLGAFQRLARANLSASDASRIFGRETQNAVMIMMRAATTGGAEWNRIMESIQQSTGESARVAGERLDNLGDDFTKFRNSLSRAATAVGDAGLTRSLRDLVQIATMVSESLQGIAPPATRFGQIAANIADTIRTVGTAINGWVQNFGALTAGIALSMRTLSAFGAALATVQAPAQALAAGATMLGLRFRAVATGILAIVSVGATVAAQFGLMGDKVAEFIGSISGWEAALAGLFVFFRASPFGVFIRALILLTGYVTTFRDEAGQAFVQVAEKIGTAMDNAVTAFYRVFPRFDDFVTRVRAAIGGAVEAVREFGEKAEPLVRAAVEGMLTGASYLADGFAALADVFSPVGKVLDDLTASGNGTALAFAGLALAVPGIIRLGAAVLGLAAGGGIMAALARGVTLVSVALRLLVSSNPIGLFVQAVLLGISLVITYWDDLAPALRRGARAVAEAFEGLANRADAIMRSLRDAIAGYWEGIVDVTRKGAAALASAVGNAGLRLGVTGTAQERRALQAVDAEERIRQQEARRDASRAQVQQFERDGVQPAPIPRAGSREAQNPRSWTPGQRLTQEMNNLLAIEEELTKLRAAYQQNFRDVEDAEKESMRRRFNAHEEFIQSVQRLWNGDRSFGNLFSEALERNSNPEEQARRNFDERARELRELEEQAIRTAERLAEARARLASLPADMDVDPETGVRMEGMDTQRQAAADVVRRLEGEQERIKNEAERISGDVLTQIENYGSVLRRGGGDTSAAIESVATMVAQAARYFEGIMRTIPTGMQTADENGILNPGADRGVGSAGLPRAGTTFRDAAVGAAERVRSSLSNARTGPDWTAGAEAQRAMPPSTRTPIRNPDARPNAGPTDTGRGADQFDDSVLRLVRRYAPALRAAVESQDNTKILDQLAGMDPDELQRRYRLAPEQVRMIRDRVQRLEGDPYNSITQFVEQQQDAVRVATVSNRRDREVQGQVLQQQRRLRDQGIDVESFRTQQREQEAIVNDPGKSDSERAAARTRLASITQRLAEADAKLAEARTAAEQAYDAQVMQRFNDQLQDTIRGYEQEVQLLGVGGVARERMQVALQAENQLRQQGITNQDQITTAVNRSVEAFDRFRVARDAAQGDPFAGFRRGLENYAKEVNDLASAAERGFTRIAGAVEDALVDMVVTGKANFADLARTVAAELARIAVRAIIIRSLLAAFGWATGGGGLSQGDIGALGSAAGTTLNHNGSVVGSPSPNETRSPVPGMVRIPTRHKGGMIGTEDGANGSKTILASAIDNVAMAGAQRRHWGGMTALSSNEVPIIAKKGEAIFPTTRLPDGQFGIRAELPREMMARDAPDVVNNWIVGDRDEGSEQPNVVNNYIVGDSARAADNAGAMLSGPQPASESIGEGFQTVDSAARAADNAGALFGRDRAGDASYEATRRAEELADGVAPAKSAVAGGGAPIHIENHIQVSISGADAQGVMNGDQEAMQRVGAMLGDMIRVKVNEALADAMRPGGMLNRGR